MIRRILRELYHLAADFWEDFRDGLAHGKRIAEEQEKREREHRPTTPPR